MAAGYFPRRLISFPAAETRLALLYQPLRQLAPPPNSKETSHNLSVNTRARTAGSFILYSLHHSGTC